MNKAQLILLLVVSCVGCSPKIQPSVSSSHAESSDTSYCDTTALGLIPQEETKFNILSYCDSLELLKQKDSTIKYIPFYIEDPKSGLIIKTLKDGNALLQKKADTLEFKLRNKIVTNKIKDSVTVTVYPKNYCSKRIHIFYEYFTKISLVLIALVIGIKVLKK